MSKEKPYVVIMAGGIGSRFWPYSRISRPKQFIDILGMGKSLIRNTFERFLPITEIEKIYIVTNEEYGNLVAEQIPEISDDQILKEPARRNTAPCVAYAAYKIATKDPSAIMVVTPSDHAIFDESKFRKIIRRAVKNARDSEKLVTIGIKPNRPETGYGYIQFYHGEKGKVRKVKTFTEKPNLELARKFIESGEFVWNAGIFVWSLPTVMQAIKSNLPEIAEAFEELNADYYTPQEQEKLKTAYTHCRNISVDYGIMEKASNVYVVLANFGWSDLGNWGSLHEILKKDKHENVIEANALVYESKDCILKGPEDKLIVVEGLDGYLVAEYGNVLLICKKDNEKRIREFVGDAKSKKGEDYL